MPEAGLEAWLYLERSREALRRWMNEGRARSERRLGLPAGDPAAIHDHDYAAALAAWAAWNDVTDDVITLLADTDHGSAGQAREGWGR